MNESDINLLRISGLKKIEIKSSIIWRNYYPLAFICLFSLIITFADSIMSYASPIYMEQKLGSSWAMGLIFASSSVFGAVCDMFFGTWFRKRGYSFSLLMGGLSGLLFPLTFLYLPSNIAFFFLAMAIWGIYYEFLRFGRFQFIPKFFKKDMHALTWGMISVFSALTVTVAPVVASELMEKNSFSVFKYSVPFYAGAIIFLIIFQFLNGDHRVILNNNYEQELPKLRLGQTLDAWSVIFKKIWPILILILILSALDSTFWSVGTLLSEEIKSSGHGLLLFLYSLPAVFIGIFVSRFGKPFGKKKAAFASSLFGGIVIAFMFFKVSTLLVLAITLVSSIFISIAWPELDAVFEDYVARSEHSAESLIGIQGASVNVGYVIGPILAGLISTFINNRSAIAFMGILTILASILCLLHVPRKIKIPHKKLLTIG